MIKNLVVNKSKGEYSDMQWSQKNFFGGFGVFVCNHNDLNPIIINLKRINIINVKIKFILKLNLLHYDILLC